MVRPVAACQGVPRHHDERELLASDAESVWVSGLLVLGKYVQPAWTPPAEVKADNPKLPDVIPGGAPKNPMGVAAMTLSGGEYAIHGTNRPESIGKFTSYGCIRMLNQDPTCWSGWTSAPRSW